MTTPLKIKKPNALDFYKLRQPTNLPPHFNYIQIPFQYNLKEVITKWVSVTLKGRFYVGKSVKINNTNSIVECLVIGFEDPKELSYFTLACPHLKYS